MLLTPVNINDLPTPRNKKRQAIMEFAAGETQAVKVELKSSGYNSAGSAYANLRTLVQRMGLADKINVRQLGDDVYLIKKESEDDDDATDT